MKQSSLLSRVIGMAVGDAIGAVLIVLITGELPQIPILIGMAVGIAAGTFCSLLFERK